RVQPREQRPKRRGARDGARRRGRRRKIPRAALAVLFQAAQVDRRSDGRRALVRAEPIGPAGQGHGDPQRRRVGVDRRQQRRRPDVYKELFPGETGEVTFDPNAPKQRPRGEGAPGAAGGEDADTGAATSTDYRSRNSVGEGIKKYLTAHPEIRGVFWGQGGSTGLRRQLYPMQDKFLGTFVTDNVYTLQSQMSTYPGDVWQLAEEQLL